MRERERERARARERRIERERKKDKERKKERKTERDKAGATDTCISGRRGGGKKSMKAMCSDGSPRAPILVRCTHRFSFRTDV